MQSFNFYAAFEVQTFFYCTLGSKTQGNQGRCSQRNIAANLRKMIRVHRNKYFDS